MMYLQEVGWGIVDGSIGSGYGSVKGSCEHSKDGGSMFLGNIGIDPY
jgi:hypothetical protein